MNKVFTSLGYKVFDFFPNSSLLEIFRGLWKEENLFCWNGENGLGGQQVRCDHWTGWIILARDVKNLAGSKIYSFVSWCGKLVNISRVRFRHFELFMIVILEIFVIFYSICQKELSWNTSFSVQWVKWSHQPRMRPYEEGWNRT